MSDSQGGPGRREVAYRLFAAEYDDADFSYSESDEERAPNYVITPTGARVNRLFVVGVLTEVEHVSEDYLRARVVDPTGPFVIYAGQYQPEAMNFLERAEPPLYVAVTGKARTFQPEDSDLVYTSIRPESISEVDDETRDRWVVQAAEQTVERVTRAAEAKLSGVEGDQLTAALKAHGVEESLADGIPLALDHYGMTGEYLAAVRELALDSARVVADERDEVAGLSMAPGDGTDDPLATLAADTIDVEAVESTGTDGVDLSEAPEPDEEPSPTDEEIDEAVESADIEGGAAEASSADETPEATTQTSAETGATETEQVRSTSEGSATEASTVEAGEDPGGDVQDEPAQTAAATESQSPSTEPEPGVGDAAAETDATADSETGDADDDLEEFDGEFELDEEERAEIEEEFGTEFQSGSEVEEPGSADIETPDEPPVEPGEEPLEEGASDEAFEATAADEGDEDEDAEVMQDFEEAEPAGDADEESSESAEEVAFDDAVMDAMVDLDDGEGADRDAVVAEVVQSTGADPGEVEDAIQEALMDGRCYEPDDQTLKAI